MKKIVSAACTACFAAALCLFAGCAPAVDDTALSGRMEFVLDDKAGTIVSIEADLSGFTTADRAIDVLDSLVEGRKICYSGSNGLYGVMLTGVGVVETDADGAQIERYILREDATAGRYLYLYTSVDEDKNDSEGMTTVDYEGQILAESLYGVGSMHVEAGAVIYITYYTYA